MLKKVIKKWNDMPPAAKSAVAFTISSLFIKGVAFITTPIFTRIMTTDQYGVLTVYNSWNSILEVFALLGLTSAGVFNTGLNDYRECRDKFISAILILCNVQTVAIFLVILGLKLIIGYDFILPINLLIIMFIQFIFNPAQIFWITRQRYEYKYKLATIISISSSILSQIVAVFCVKNIYVYNSVEIKLWSSGLSFLVFSIPIYFTLLKRGRCLFDKQIWKEILIFAIPLIPHYLAQHVMSSADRIMISEMVSNTDAAIYSLASTVSLIATVIWGAINASITPYIYDKLNSKKYKNIDSTVVQILLGYAIVCVGVSLVAPEVIKILGTKEYSKGIYAIPPIAATAFLCAMYNIYATIEFYHKKSFYITIATIVSCAVNVVLNYCFIPTFGFIAASYTTLFSYIVLILMHYYGYKKSQKESVYNDKMMFFITVVTLVGCEVCNLIYINNVIRYAIIAVILMMVIYKRNSLLNKIRELKRGNGE